MVRRNETKFAIIGLGRFKGSICQTLVEAGQGFTIDSSEDRVNEYEYCNACRVANAQDEMTLRLLGIGI